MNIHCALPYFVTCAGFVDGYPARAKEIQITVAQTEDGLEGHADNDNLCIYVKGPVASGSTNIPCESPKRGKWLQVQFLYAGHMQIAELEVHGY